MDYTVILIKIRKIVRSINLESKRIQKKFDVSIPQILCLKFLRESENFRSTQQGISVFLNLNASTVTGIVNRLERKGMVARLPKTGDRRLTYIALTTAGDRLLDRIPPLLHDRLAAKLESGDSAELNDIESALDHLIGLLEIENVTASPLLATGDEELEDPS